MLPFNEVVIATRNRGKAGEFAQFFAKYGVAVRSLNDFPDAPDIVEDGATFAENAVKKANTIAGYLARPVLADDSGLCVDALGGEPGVFSARYAGEGAGDAENNAKLLRTLEAAGANADVAHTAAASPETATGGEHPPLYSAAKFVCALALAEPGNDRPVIAEGELAGYILREPRGSGGFGYDPLFYLPQYGRSLAELPLAEKNRISHRAAALQNLLRLLSGADEEDAR